MLATYNINIAHQMSSPVHTMVCCGPRLSNTLLLCADMPCLLATSALLGVSVCNASCEGDAC